MTTGVSPTQLLFGRQPRTHLALLRKSCGRQAVSAEKILMIRRLEQEISVLVTQFLSGTLALDKNG